MSHTLATITVNRHAGDLTQRRVVDEIATVCCAIARR
jgi:hypothetical protein